MISLKFLCNNVENTEPIWKFYFHIYTCSFPYIFGDTIDKV